MATNWTARYVNSLNPRRYGVEDSGNHTHSGGGGSGSGAETWLGDQTTTPVGLSDTQKDPPTVTTVALSKEDTNHLVNYYEYGPSAVKFFLENQTFLSELNSTIRSQDLGVYNPSDLAFLLTQFMSWHGTVYPSPRNPLFTTVGNACFNITDQDTRIQFPIQITNQFETTPATTCFAQAVTSSISPMGDADYTDPNGDVVPCQRDTTRCIYAKTAQNVGIRRISQIGQARPTVPLPDPTTTPPNGFPHFDPATFTDEAQRGTRYGFDDLMYDKVPVGGNYVAFMGRLDNIKRENLMCINERGGNTAPANPGGATGIIECMPIEMLPTFLYGHTGPLALFSGVGSAIFNFANVAQSAGPRNTYPIYPLCDTYYDRQRQEFAGTQTDRYSAGLGSIRYAGGNDVAASSGELPDIRPGIGYLTSGSDVSEDPIGFVLHKIRSFADDGVGPPSSSEQRGFGNDVGGVTIWDNDTPSFPKTPGPMFDRFGDPGVYTFSCRITNLCLEYDVPASTGPLPVLADAQAVQTNANNKPMVEFGFWIVGSDAFRAYNPDGTNIPDPALASQLGFFIAVANLQYPGGDAVIQVSNAGAPTNPRYSKVRFFNASARGTVTVDGNFSEYAQPVLQQVGTTVPYGPGTAVWKSIHQAIYDPNDIDSGATTDFAFGNYGMALPAVRCVEYAGGSREGDENVYLPSNIIHHGTAHWSVRQQRHP